MSDRTALLEELRVRFQEVIAAERRLRGRDSHRPEGLSVAHVRVLFRLAKAEGHQLPAGRLAAAVEVSPASLSQMVDGLERRGVVERIRSEEDRRVVVLHLTDAGLQQVREQRDRFLAIWERELAELPDADLEAAAKVLVRFRSVFDSLCDDV
jgi:DNA-binding MarR family transcriptional regulator